MEDIRDARGVAITIRNPKTDQEAQARPSASPRTTGHDLPRDRARRVGSTRPAICTGPVFRRFTRSTAHSRRSGSATMSSGGSLRGGRGTRPGEVRGALRAGVVMEAYRQNIPRADYGDDIAQAHGDARAGTGARLTPCAMACQVR